MDSVPFFPDRASTMAGQVDNLYFAWLVLSGLVALAVAVLIVWFAIRYRQGPAAKRTLADAAEREKKMHRIEIIWTVVPLVLFIAMFVWSARVYYLSVTVPKDALPIYVVAKQWMWHAEHPGGEREIDELHVPADRPVELVMTSQDVIHSLSIPDFRVKQDVLPGRYTTLWFTANRPASITCFARSTAAPRTRTWSGGSSSWSRPPSRAGCRRTPTCRPWPRAARSATASSAAVAATARRPPCTRPDSKACSAGRSSCTTADSCSPTSASYAMRYCCRPRTCRPAMKRTCPRIAGKLAKKNCSRSSSTSSPWATQHRRWRHEQRCNRGTRKLRVTRKLFE